ncbi:hypothetical protein CUMW_119200 [Citrus unshiu]|nr:hypothetical protein CUMW_119200 [Citrus unshiu]
MNQWVLFHVLVNPISCHPDKISPYQENRNQRFLDAVVKERERINYVKDIEDNRKVCFAEKDADEPWLDQTETLQKGLCRRLGL